MASVMDMASRRVLGFALGEHHDAQLAYGALVMAAAVRGGQVPGVILHTDQGSEEYTAGLVRQACQRLGVSQSMGRPGSALDNAVIESWHSTLEFELRSVWSTSPPGQRPGPGSPHGSRTTTGTGGTPRWAMMSLSATRPLTFLWENLYCHCASICWYDDSISNRPRR
jgi:transposase InsO family protein